MNIKLSTITKAKLKELAAKMGVTTNDAVIIAIASLHFQEVNNATVVAQAAPDAQDFYDEAEYRAVVAKWIATRDAWDMETAPTTQTR